MEIPIQATSVDGTLVLKLKEAESREERSQPLFGNSNVKHQICCVDNVESKRSADVLEIPIQ